MLGAPDHPEKYSQLPDGDFGEKLKQVDEWFLKN